MAAIVVGRPSSLALTACPLVLRPQVHALGHEPTKLPTIDKFAGAVTAVRFLKTFKNLDA